MRQKCSGTNWEKSQAMVFEKEKETPCLCAKIVTTPQALDWLRSKKFILNHREQNSGAKISITQSYAKKNGKRYILPSRKPNDFLGKMYIYRFTGNAPPSARALSHVLWALHNAIGSNALRTPHTSCFTPLGRERRYSKTQVLRNHYCSKCYITASWRLSNLKAWHLELVEIYIIFQARPLNC